MDNIKAIIFDFGGVILNIDYDRTTKAFTELGVKNFEEMFSQQTADPLFQHLEEGKITEIEFYEKFRKITKVEITDNQIKNAWNAMLLSYRKDALQTIKSIRHKYKLYLLSNTNSIHRKAFQIMYKEEIGDFPIENYFDKTYYSHKIGCRKPGKDAYEYVINKNNLVVSETLFIDDSIQNIEAAESLGLQTVFLKKGMVVEGLDL